MAVKDKIQLEQTEPMVAKETTSAVMNVPVKSQPQTVQQVSKTAIAEEKFSIAELVDANKVCDAQKDLLAVALSVASKGGKSKNFTIKEAKSIIAEFSKKGVQ